MRGRLVLFDIDGTLIDARGAGLEAPSAGPAGNFMEGRFRSWSCVAPTDSGLARDILASFGVEISQSSITAFYESYLFYLEEHLGGGQFQGVVLPGVRELLQDLREAGAVLGLLTGNVEAGACAKMKHFGLSEFFDFGAFGDDHHDRNELGPHRSRAGRGSARGPLRGRRDGRDRRYS